MQLSGLTSTNCWRCCFLRCAFWASLSKIRCSYMFGSLILFHWSLLSVFMPIPYFFFFGLFVLRQRSHYVALKLRYLASVWPLLLPQSVRVTEFQGSDSQWSLIIMAGRVAKSQLELWFQKFWAVPAWHCGRGGWQTSQQERGLTWNGDGRVSEVRSQAQGPEVGGLVRHMGRQGIWLWNSSLEFSVLLFETWWQVRSSALPLGFPLVSPGLRWHGCMALPDIPL